MEDAFFLKILLITTIIAHFTLGIVVFKKSSRALLKKLFLGFALNASLWSFAVLMVIISTSYESIVFWVRASHALAALTPWFVLALVYCFREEGSYPYRKVLCFLFFSLFLAFMSLTPFFIEGVTVPVVEKNPLYGHLFPLYTFSFIGVTVYAIYRLFRHLQDSRGLLRYQIKFFIGGILLSFVLGSISNLFFPLLGINFIDLRPFGPVFTLIMVFSITYAIVKYRLMDIHMAVSKTVANLLALLFIGSTCFVLLVLIEGKFNINYTVSPLYIVLLILAAALLFGPVKNNFQKLVNRFLGGGVVEYLNSLIEASKAMVSILHIDELVNFIVSTVVENIFIEGAVFFIKNNGRNYSVAATKWLYKNPILKWNYKLEWEDPLPVRLREKDDVLLRTDLLSDKSPSSRLVMEQMEMLEVEAAVAVVVEGELKGILCLGSKLSGDPYTKEDVQLLSALASQVAVSLRNAQLYQEVIEIKRYLENILRNMGNGIIAVNSFGKITTVNHAAEKLIGLRAESVLYKKMEEALPPVLSELLHKALYKGKVRNEKEVELLVNGSKVVICCHIVKINPSETHNCGAIMVLSDLTRLKELEKERIQAQKLASLGKIAAGMAHEIKNPLVSIKTFAELLNEKYDDEEFRKSFSKVVTGEIHRINNLVMELLNFSRNHQHGYEEVPIASLIDEIIYLISVQCRAQKIQVKRYYESRIPPVRGNRDQIKQALLNICLNSIQAMPEGGTLTVKVFKGDSIINKNKGIVSEANMITILVKDTGIGIEPEQKEKIFDPFYSTKPNGVGIGLSISYSIIVEHGGSISCYSRKGEGTTMKITFPVYIYNDLQLEFLNREEV